MDRILSCNKSACKYALVLSLYIDHTFRSRRFVMMHRSIANTDSMSWFEGQRGQVKTAYVHKFVQ